MDLNTNLENVIKKYQSDFERLYGNPIFIEIKKISLRKRAKHLPELTAFEKAEYNKSVVKDLNVYSIKIQMIAPFKAFEFTLKGSRGFRLAENVKRLLYNISSTIAEE